MVVRRRAEVRLERHLDQMRRLHAGGVGDRQQVDARPVEGQAGRHQFVGHKLVALAIEVDVIHAHDGRRRRRDGMVDVDVHLEHGPGGRLRVTIHRTLVADILAEDPDVSPERQRDDLQRAGARDQRGEAGAIRGRHGHRVRAGDGRGDQALPPVPLDIRARARCRIGDLHRHHRGLRRVVGRQALHLVMDVRRGPAVLVHVQRDREARVVHDDARLPGCGHADAEQLRGAIVQHVLLSGRRIDRGAQEPVAVVGTGDHVGERGGGGPAGRHQRQGRRGELVVELVESHAHQRRRRGAGVPDHHLHADRLPDGRDAGIEAEARAGPQLKIRNGMARARRVVGRQRQQVRGADGAVRDRHGHYVRPLRVRRVERLREVAELVAVAVGKGPRVGHDAHGGALHRIDPRAQARDQVVLGVTLRLDQRPGANRAGHAGGEDDHALRRESADEQQPRRLVVVLMLLGDLLVGVDLHADHACARRGEAARDRDRCRRATAQRRKGGLPPELAVRKEAHGDIRRRFGAGVVHLRGDHDALAGRRVVRAEREVGGRNREIDRPGDQRDPVQILAVLRAAIAGIHPHINGAEHRVRRVPLHAVQAARVDHVRREDAALHQHRVDERRLSWPADAEIEKAQVGRREQQVVVAHADLENGRLRRHHGAVRRVLDLDHEHPLGIAHLQRACRLVIRGPRVRGLDVDLDHVRARDRREVRQLQGGRARPGQGDLIAEQRGADLAAGLRVVVEVAHDHERIRRALQRVMQVGEDREGRARGHLRRLVDDALEVDVAAGDPQVVGQRHDHQRVRHGSAHGEARAIVHVQGDRIQPRRRGRRKQVPRPAGVVRPLRPRDVVGQGQPGGRAGNRRGDGLAVDLQAVPRARAQVAALAGEGGLGQLDVRQHDPDRARRLAHADQQGEVVVVRPALSRLRHGFDPQHAEGGAVRGSRIRQHGQRVAARGNPREHDAVDRHIQVVQADQDVGRRAVAVVLDDHVHRRRLAGRQPVGRQRRRGTARHLKLRMRTGVCRARAGGDVEGELLLAHERPVADLDQQRVRSGRSRHRHPPGEPAIHIRAIRRHGSAGDDLQVDFRPLDRVRGGERGADDLVVGQPVDIHQGARAQGVERVRLYDDADIQPRNHAHHQQRGHRVVGLVRLGDRTGGVRLHPDHPRAGAGELAGHHQLRAVTGRETRHHHGCECGVVGQEVDAERRRRHRAGIVDDAGEHDRRTDGRRRDEPQVAASDDEVHGLRAQGHDIHVLPVATRAVLGGHSDGHGAGDGVVEIPHVVELMGVGVVRGAVHQFAILNQHDAQQRSAAGRARDIEDQPRQVLEGQRLSVVPHDHTQGVRVRQQRCAVRGLLDLDVQDAGDLAHLQRAGGLVVLGHTVRIAKVHLDHVRAGHDGRAGEDQRVYATLHERQIVAVQHRRDLVARDRVVVPVAHDHRHHQAAGQRVVQVELKREDGPGGHLREVLDGRLEVDVRRVDPHVVRRRQDGQVGRQHERQGDARAVVDLHLQRVGASLARRGEADPGGAARDRPGRAVHVVRHDHRQARPRRGVGRRLALDLERVARRGVEERRFVGVAWRGQRDRAEDDRGGAGGVADADDRRRLVVVRPRLVRRGVHDHPEHAVGVIGRGRDIGELDGGVGGWGERRNGHRAGGGRAVEEPHEHVGGSRGAFIAHRRPHRRGAGRIQAIRSDRNGGTAGQDQLRAGGLGRPAVFDDDGDLLLADQRAVADVNQERVMPVRRRRGQDELEAAVDVRVRHGNLVAALDADGHVRALDLVGAGERGRDDLVVRLAGLAPVRARAPRPGDAGSHDDAGIESGHRSDHQEGGDGVVVLARLRELVGRVGDQPDDARARPGELARDNHLHRAQRRQGRDRLRRADQRAVGLEANGHVCGRADARIVHGAGEHDGLPHRGRRRTEPQVAAGDDEVDRRRVDDDLVRIPAVLVAEVLRRHRHEHATRDVVREVPRVEELISLRDDARHVRPVLDEDRLQQAARATGARDLEGQHREVSRLEVADAVAHGDAQQARLRRQVHVVRGLLDLDHEHLVGRADLQRARRLVVPRRRIGGLDVDLDHMRAFHLGGVRKVDDLDPAARESVQVRVEDGDDLVAGQRIVVAVADDDRGDEAVADGVVQVARDPEDRAAGHLRGIIDRILEVEVRAVHPDVLPGPGHGDGAGGVQRLPQAGAVGRVEHETDRAGRGGRGDEQ